MIKAKLDANESPYDLPSTLKQEILEQASALCFNRYEGPHRERLREVIAGQNGISPAGVMLGNGSDELIQLLVLAFSGPQKPVVIPSPTFSMYRFVAEQAGRKIITVPLRPPRFSLDLQELLSVLDQPGQEPLLFLCRPNNPTGNSLEQGKVEDILKTARGLVVVDEAYVEFSGSSLAPLLSRHQNLVILRTLSKAYRLAGLRVGYLLAHPAIIEELEKVMLPFNMSVFSLLSALVIMEKREELLVHLDQIVIQRQRVAARLAALPGITPLASETNFILFALSEPAAPVWAELKRRGILLRSYPEVPELATYLRVSIGSDEENTLFLNELASILAEGREGR